MAEYTLTLTSDEDYRLIKKSLKAFDSAKISPISKSCYNLETALVEAHNGNTIDIPILSKYL